MNQVTTLHEVISYMIGKGYTIADLEKICCGFELLQNQKAITDQLSPVDLIELALQLGKAVEKAVNK